MITEHDPINMIIEINEQHLLINEQLPHFSGIWWGLDQATRQMPHRKLQEWRLS